MRPLGDTAPRRDLGRVVTGRDLDDDADVRRLLVCYKPLAWAMLKVVRHECAA